MGCYVQLTKICVSVRRHALGACTFYAQLPLGFHDASCPGRGAAHSYYSLITRLSWGTGFRQRLQI